jgi:hypothetical protein
MSFSITERDTLMGLLAWSSDSESISRFQTALTQVEANPPAESRVKVLVAAIAVIDSQIATARNTVGSPYLQLLSEAQRLVYQIGNTLGVEVKRKVYG